MNDGTPLPNEEIIRLCRRSRGLLSPVITVEPTKKAVAAAVKLADKNIGEVKAFKVRLGYVDASADDPVFSGAYDFAEEKGIPVLFHTGDTATKGGDLVRSHPLTLDRLANKRAELTIVLCHFGNPWFEDAAELIYKHPKVYADMSGLTTGGGAYRQKFAGWLARKICEAVYFAGGAEKILFGTPLDTSIVPGLAVSLLVAGLLFLSPVAALVPLLIGGVAIGISLGAVYGLFVSVQHGQINFAVPFLMILTMLGLAVDYGVLQLRRTKEELSKGKTIQESVGISVRWAGQAVLTAGLTVVVAYIVLAITKVPFFGDVGEAIAIGVAILLAASLTLLPSVQLTVGKRLFWPRQDKNAEGPPSVAKRKLESVPDKILRHKVAISVVISLLALGSFYVAYQTPSGIDISKLIPNFESNQGLTVITNNFGGSTVAPTLVVVTFPYPIVNSRYQFNQTQLRQIETISSVISASPGVETISSPTRPYGASFNYTGLASLPPPVQAQYLGGMLSMVGKDNRTALFTIGLSQPSQSSAAITDLGSIEAAVGAIPLPLGTTVYFGGSTQSAVDTLDLINGVLPFVVLILAVGVFFILFAQLRSIFTPVRLIFTILCSVSFALGLLSILFYYVLQTPVVSLAPLFVVVTMLGVGVDYDIFLVTRIREEAMRGISDLDAIKTAMNKTWITLLGLGLILSSVFGSLAASGIGLLAEIGVSAALALMVDVGVVIFLFVPSLMAIAQKYNWWPGKVRQDLPGPSPEPKGP